MAKKKTNEKIKIPQKEMDQMSREELAQARKLIEREKQRLDRLDSKLRKQQSRACTKHIRLGEWHRIDRAADDTIFKAEQINKNRVEGTIIEITEVESDGWTLYWKDDSLHIRRGSNRIFCVWHTNVWADDIMEISNLSILITKGMNPDALLKYRKSIPVPGSARNNDWYAFIDGKWVLVETHSEYF